MILQSASYSGAEHPLPTGAMLEYLPCHFSGSVETHIPDNSVDLIRSPLPSE